MTQFTTFSIFQLFEYIPSHNYSFGSSRFGVVQQEQRCNYIGNGEAAVVDRDFNDDVVVVKPMFHQIDIVHTQTLNYHVFVFVDIPNVVLCTRCLKFIWRFNMRNFIWRFNMRNFIWRFNMRKN